MKKLLTNNKGLIGGLIAFMSVIFFMAVISIIATQMWTQTNQAFQNLDNNTASPEVKAKISHYGQIMYYGDYFIIYTFIALFIGYLITSAVSNTSNPIFLLIFLGVLIFVTLVAMMLSNAWKFMLSQDFITEQENYKLTDFILTYFPIITFFTGITGIIIFYSRRNNNVPTGGGEF